MKSKRKLKRKAKRYPYVNNKNEMMEKMLIIIPDQRVGLLR